MSPALAVATAPRPGQHDKVAQRLKLMLLPGGKPEWADSRTMMSAGSQGNFFGARAPRFEGGLMAKPAGTSVAREVKKFKLPTEAPQEQKEKPASKQAPTAAKPRAAANTTFKEPGLDWELRGSW